MSPRRALELSLPAEWSAIRTAWEPCHDALHAGGLAEDERYALCMVVQELLENAVKYGDASPGARVRLALEVGGEEITVEVSHPVHADEEQLRRFDRAVQWLRGFQDPFEAYVERLKLVSAESYRGGQSGLGLTRIAYEGKCIIDFFLDEAGTLAVSAVYRRPDAAPAPPA